MHIDVTGDGRNDSPGNTTETYEQAPRAKKAYWLGRVVAENAAAKAAGDAELAAQHAANAAWIAAQEAAYLNTVDGRGCIDPTEKPLNIGMGATLMVPCVAGWCFSGFEDTGPMEQDFEDISANIDQLSNEGGADPLEGTHYSDKVYGQMNSDSELHNSSEKVDDFAGSDGVVTQEPGGDDRLYTHIRIPTEWRGEPMNFHYIVDPAGEINHRMIDDW